MPPRSSCFLGCFGGSSSSGGSPENKQPLQKGEESNSMKRTRNSKWFSWSKLKKKSWPRRTVPIDGTAAEKVHQKKGSTFLINSSKKLHKDQTPAPVTGKIVHSKPNKTKSDEVQEIVLENSKSMNSLDSMMKATCKKGLSTVSKCTSQKSICNPTSREDKFEVSRRKVAFSHSVSMPPPIRNNMGDINGGDSKVDRKEKTSERRVRGSGFDQVIGISFIVVSLIIMVFWGRICAILCTSAWFYFYPLLRAKNEPKVDQESASKSGNCEHQLHLNSQEYKKKVVLEGILERNHRIY